jgi:hypothetical protein
MKFRVERIRVLVISEHLCDGFLLLLAAGADGLRWIGRVQPAATATKRRIARRWITEWVRVRLSNSTHLIRRGNFMTRLRSVVRGSVVRDLALVGLAVAVGWWWHGSGATVMAERSGSSSSANSSYSGADSGLAFQINGWGEDATLTVFNPTNRTLYVYPQIGVGNAYALMPGSTMAKTINCGYSFTVTTPGAPIQRKNCVAGESVPQN